MTPIPHTSQLTAESWMLFCDMEGAGDAARDLTDALETALTCDTREQAWRVVNPVLLSAGQLTNLDRISHSLVQGEAMACEGLRRP